MSGDRHPDYDERGAMTNAPGPPSGPRWRCTCGGWNPASEPVCRFSDCDERKPGRVPSWSIGGDDAAQRLMRQVRRYNRAPVAPTPEQVATVLHALADHTALLQAVDYRPTGEGAAVSAGRWLHDLGDYVERSPDA